MILLLQLLQFDSFDFTEKLMAPVVVQSLDGEMVAMTLENHFLVIPKTSLKMKGDAFGIETQEGDDHVVS